jgi:hypothetical protein
MATAWLKALRYAKPRRSVAGDGRGNLPRLEIAPPRKIRMRLSRPERFYDAGTARAILRTGAI